MAVEIIELTRHEVLVELQSLLGPRAPASLSRMNTQRLAARYAQTIGLTSDYAIKIVSSRARVTVQGRDTYRPETTEGRSEESLEAERHGPGSKRRKGRGFVSVEIIWNGTFAEFFGYRRYGRYREVEYAINYLYAQEATEEGQEAIEAAIGRYGTPVLYPYSEGSQALDIEESNIGTIFEYVRGYIGSTSRGESGADYAARAEQTQERIRVANREAALPAIADIANGNGRW